MTRSAAPNIGALRAELQMPFWFLPKEVGLKGSVYADAGGLYDYKGPTAWAADRRSQRARLHVDPHGDDLAGRRRHLPRACSLTTATWSAPRWVSA